MKVLLKLHLMKGLSALLQILYHVYDSPGVCIQETTLIIPCTH